MRAITKSAATAAVGVLLFVCTSSGLSAQPAAPDIQPISRVAAVSPGGIHGVVQDERGAPVGGAVVSALGATTVIAVTDRTGRFEMRALMPGPYLVQARLSGFVASRGQIIEVRPSARTSSAIELRRASSPASTSVPVVEAGLGAPSVTAGGDTAVTPETAGGDDHGETAWRLRHARRGILRDADIPDLLTAADDPGGGGAAGFLGRVMASPARAASSFFTETPFSGQLNLLTTGSFDSPQQLFTADSFARGVAYIAVAAPVGSSADWAVRGALTQGDVSSWIVASSYATRAPARHRFTVGLSYSTQRYTDGNAAAFTAVSTSSRSGGELRGFDTFTITPAISLTYGARYARYDYLAPRGLVSPRVEVTLSPAAHFRVNASVSRQALAPGAEEFVPPADAGIWLPPQRIFASYTPESALAAERTDHLQVGVERDVAGSTVSLRAFRQRTADQLTTLFGVDVPGRPATEIGHYLVANTGNVNAAGWSASVRTAIANRLHGSVAYTMTRAVWAGGDGLPDMILLATPRAEANRIHDLSTSIETSVPETSTRVVVLYRLSTGFARRDGSGDRGPLDARFDVQIRQSLPFMNFSTAQWEALIAVRNFFREASADQSIYDELLVLHPPKRIVGGLTLRF